LAILFASIVNKPGGTGAQQATSSSTNYKNYFTDVKVIYKGMQQKPVQRLYCSSTTGSVYEKYCKNSEVFNYID